MTLAWMVTTFTGLNPVTTLDSDPLILARIKSVAVEELLSFLKSQKASMLTSNISLVVFVVHLLTRRFYVPDLLSFEVLITNLIENQLAHLGASAITVVCLDSENELFGRPMCVDFPFIPLPALIPLSGLVVHLVNHLFTFIIINCHELPLLRIPVITIIC